MWFIYNFNSVFPTYLSLTLCSSVQNQPWPLKLTLTRAQRKISFLFSSEKFYKKSKWSFFKKHFVQNFCLWIFYFKRCWITRAQIHCSQLQKSLTEVGVVTPQTDIEIIFNRIALKRIELYLHLLVCCHQDLFFNTLVHETTIQLLYLMQEYYVLISVTLGLYSTLFDVRISSASVHAQYRLNLMCATLWHQAFVSACHLCAPQFASFVLKSHSLCL